MLRFGGQVAVITGGGRGIGEALCRFLAARGAKVVVNDVGCDVTGKGGSHAPADAVVKAIRDAGGVAVADYHDVSLLLPHFCLQAIDGYRACSRCRKVRRLWKRQ